MSKAQQQEIALFIENAHEMLEAPQVMKVFCEVVEEWLRGEKWL